MGTLKPSNSISQLTMEVNFDCYIEPSVLRDLEFPTNDPAANCESRKKRSKVEQTTFKSQTANACRNQGPTFSGEKTQKNPSNVYKRRMWPSFQNDMPTSTNWHRVVPSLWRPYWNNISNVEINDNNSWKMQQFEAANLSHLATGQDEQDVQDVQDEQEEESEKRKKEPFEKAITILYSCLSLTRAVEPWKCSMTELTLKVSSNRYDGIFPIAGPIALWRDLVPTNSLNQICTDSGLLIIQTK